jgi:hypothetical protein
MILKSAHMTYAVPNNSGATAVSPIAGACEPAGWLIEKSGFPIDQQPSESRRGEVPESDGPHSGCEHHRRCSNRSRPVEYPNVIDPATHRR